MVKCKMPKGYKRFKKSMRIKPGDKIVVDLGGIECARGKVHDPNDADIDRKPVVSFWSYSGWRHLELAKKSQIKYIKKVK